MPLIGAKRHIARLKHLAGPRGPKLVGKALFTGAERIAVEAQVSITTGAVSGKFHVPSLPGEAPNADTHVLSDNIEATQVGPLVAEVSSNAPYARIEWDWGRVEARPYMRPARDKKKGEVVDLVNQALNQLVRESRSNLKD